MNFVFNWFNLIDICVFMLCWWRVFIIVKICFLVWLFFLIVLINFFKLFIVIVIFLLFKYLIVLINFGIVFLVMILLVFKCGFIFFVVLFKKILLDNLIKKFFNSVIVIFLNFCVYNKFSMKKIFEKVFLLKIIKNNYV